MLLLLVPLLLLGVACGSGGDDADDGGPAAAQATAPAQPQARADNPVDKVTLGSEQVKLSFWHTQTGPNEAKLKEIIDKFHAKFPNIRIEPEFVDGYTNLYKKLLTAISANQWPDLAVAYPSQVAEYQQANAVVPLDDYITSEKYGFTKAELDDFIESYLAESRYYPEYGNKYLSFPFTKSLLVMYYNEDALKAAGQKVPTTWDEFREVCKAVTKGDTKCLSIEVSASTFNGMLYSRGSKIISDDLKTWQMNNEDGVASLQLLQDMIKEGTAVRAAQRFADQTDFAQGKVIFTMGSTSGIPFYDDAVKKNANFKWGLANIPHGTGDPAATVLYGASISIFKSNPQKQLAAWEFIKFFSSPEITADWGPASGYLPVRKSAQSQKPVADYVAKFPPYGVAMNDVSPTAKPETSNRGTQTMREELEAQVAAALAEPTKPAKQFLDEAWKKSQAALNQ
jgi:ABC-type glycerol-3-phosphate transport system substrate-binding protein